jgi:hypothetical protein
VVVVVVVASFARGFARPPPASITFRARPRTLIAHVARVAEDNEVAANIEARRRRRVRRRRRDGRASSPSGLSTSRERVVEYDVTHTTRSVII